MKIKLTENAKRLQLVHGISFLPERGTAMSAGLGLKVCLEYPVTFPPGTCMKIPTGVHVWLDTPNLAGFLLPSSSCKQFVLLNTIGVIDGDYQGEIFALLKNVSDEVLQVVPGQKLFQLVITKVCSDSLEIVEEFREETTKGEGGYGNHGTYA